MKTVFASADRFVYLPIGDAGSVSVKEADRHAVSRLTRGQYVVRGAASAKKIHYDTY